MNGFRLYMNSNAGVSVPRSLQLCDMKVEVNPNHGVKDDIASGTISIQGMDSLTECTTHPNIIEGTLVSSGGAEPSMGCAHPFALNYDAGFVAPDYTELGSCKFKVREILGCTYPDAFNYNPLATIDDYTCFFS